MSIVEMQKVHLVALKDEKDAILKLLQDQEVIDIQTIEDGEMERLKDGEGTKLEYQLAEIKSVITFLEGIEQKKKSFIESFLPPKEEVTEEELRQTCQYFDCAGAIKKYSQLENHLANLRHLKNELCHGIAKLIPWQKLDCPLNNLAATDRIAIASGKIRNKQLPNFKSGLKKVSSAAHLELVNQTKNESYLLVIFLAPETASVNKFLSASQFESIDLPIPKKTPGEEIKRLKSILNNSDAEVKNLMSEAKSQLGQLLRLKYMYDTVLEQKATLELKEKLANTNYAFIVEGWIKKSDVQSLRSNVARITSDFEIFGIEPAKGEKPPVILQNPRPFSPFELITHIYGTPKHNELDPSIPLAFFFSLFFGICLGDFGYGLVLAAFSIYFMKRHRLTIGGKHLFQLLMFGGFVAAVVGALTGSYLGFSIKEIPESLLSLKYLLTSIQIIDPIKSPLIMLVFSLALGVVQILFGIILQMALKIRQKDYFAAADDVLWFFFLGSLVFLIVANAMTLPYTGIASKLSIGGAIALVLTQGRHKKGLIQKFFSGLLSLYKVSGYMGDTLSYSRLLALGMSTTIIGSVINILAGMVKGGVPGLGIILMIALLIFGHIFNLIIGTLGAFVHSTRLQMVEFF
ncbi:V-type ATP synthase subunit I [Candidatus Margulisiibacteriota bacterium]